MPGPDPIPIIQTKLNRPHLAPELVARPHLTQRLTDGLDRKLSLVSAPAGFGKTTLLVEWAAQTELPLGWYALDGLDNDLGTFLSYLITALRSAYPQETASDICPSITAFSKAPLLPDIPTLVSALVADISKLPCKTVLVLDDYYRIHDPVVTQFMDLLLEHLPTRLHLVVISRVDPHFPISRMRVRGELNEIRVRDLRFSSTEFHRYLRRTVDPNFQEEAATILTDRTEGWAAGLQLAAIRIRSQQPETYLGFSKDFKGNQNQIVAYLTDEVLSQQPKVVQVFLIKTAFLDRFCAPLAAKVTGFSETRCSEIIHQILAKDLFIVPLDDDQRWFRYHHLFQDLLQHKLATQVDLVGRERMQARAAVWFSEQGLVEEALQHFLAAGEVGEAARLVEDQVHHQLNRQDWRTLERWLGYLPAEVLQGRPALVLAQAWIHHNQYDLLALPELLEHAQGLMNEGNPDLTAADRKSLQGELDALMSFIWLIQNNFQETYTGAQSAITNIPPDHSFAYGYAHLTYGLATFFMGQEEQALDFLRRQLHRYGAHSTLFTSRVLETLECIHLYAGRLGSLLELSRQRLTIAQGANLPIDIGWAHLFMGMARYERNELEAAQEHLLTASKLRNLIHFRVYHDSQIGLARIRQAQGDEAGAWQIAEDLLEATTLTQNHVILPETYAFRAHLALRQGKGQVAQNWLQSGDSHPTAWAFTSSELPVLVRIKIFLAEGSEASLSQAEALLESLYGEAVRFNHTFRQVELLALRALAYEAKGQSARALSELQQALEKGKPDRFIRTFVDLGPGMARLLFRLLEGGIEVSYAGRLLAAFEGHPPTQTARRSSHQGLSERRVLPLTEREAQILELLNQRYSNKEIARELNIALGTVKRHTANIYTKLGVQNRRQAVKFAENFGMLE